MSDMRTIVSALLIMLALGAVGVPSNVAVASDSKVKQCYDEVIADCDLALADANWLEKVGIGALCTLMLLGCGGEAIGG